MNEHHLSVAEFNQLINVQLGSLGEFVVEGEITQMNVTSKGGVNIVLKDTKDQAILNISGFAPRIQGLGMVKEGMLVSVWGTAQIWSAGGRFSLSIYKILPMGTGALQAAYEQLKQKLTAEGLFAEDRKRPLPDFLTKIALVTAKDSAAASDFLKILRENQINLEIDLYNVQVQGKYAETEIIGTLKHLSTTGDEYDLIVLTRGGGSLEDLIAFNDENLARSIFALEIPTVVGVGHEKDETIADFVADLRASTPSQAAYYLVSQNQSFIQSLLLETDKIAQQILSKAHRLNLQIGNKLHLLDSLFQNRHLSFSSKLQKLQLLTQNYLEQLANLKQKAIYDEKILNSYNPKNVLKRGFSLVKNHEGKYISSIKHVKKSQKLDLVLQDGTVKSVAEQIISN